MCISSLSLFVYLCTKESRLVYVLSQCLTKQVCQWWHFLCLCLYTCIYVFACLCVCVFLSLDVPASLSGYLCIYMCILKHLCVCVPGVCVHTLVLDVCAFLCKVDYMPLSLDTCVSLSNMWTSWVSVFLCPKYECLLRTCVSLPRNVCERVSEVNCVSLTSVYKV